MHRVCDVCDEVVFAMAITVVSVAKSYSNRGNHVHRQGTKKRWYLYYIDGDGKFRTKRINALEALLYKGLKSHRYRVVCPECEAPLVAFVRSVKEDVECPQCGCSIILDELDDEAIDALPEEDDP
ncbi:MAG: hypothetical protein ACREAO_10785 [Nitrososphaera sp.]